MTTDLTPDQVATLAAARDLIEKALLTEYRRRIDERIEASPEEHCSALATAVADVLSLRAVVPAAPGRLPRAFLLHPRQGDPLPGVEMPGEGGAMLFEDWDQGLAVRASSLRYLVAGGYHDARIEWADQPAAPPIEANAPAAAAGHVHKLGNPDDDGGLLDDWDNCRDPECPGPAESAGDEGGRD